MRRAACTWRLNSRQLRQPGRYPLVVYIVRFHNPLRPACPVQGTVRFRFGAVLLHEFDHRQTLLELHEIDRHGGALGGEVAIVTCSVANHARAS